MNEAPIAVNDGVDLATSAGISGLFAEYYAYFDTAKRGSTPADGPESLLDPVGIEFCRREPAGWWCSWRTTLTTVRSPTIWRATSGCRTCSDAASLE